MNNINTEMLESLTPIKFKEWLLAKQDEEIVGYSWSSNSCPIVNYLKYVEKERYTVEVGATCFFVNKSFYVLPEWCRKLIKKVDNEPEGNSKGINKIKILNFLESEA